MGFYQLANLKNFHSTIFYNLRGFSFYPISTKFHESFGFYEVGQQETEGGAKRVSLMVKDMTDGLL